MTFARVHFHASARTEAEAAVGWYEERQPGLGADFVNELERAVVQIAEAPETWPPCPQDGRARRLLLSRFPFSVVYVVRPNHEVVIVAMAHTRRRPAYWRERISERR